MPAIGNSWMFCGKVSYFIIILVQSDSPNQEPTSLSNILIYIFPQQICTPLPPSPQKQNNPHVNYC